MMSTNRFLSRGRLPVVAAIVVLMTSAGCAVQEQNAPPLSGPSELGLSVQISAAPEFLPRDGSSMSTITTKAYDPNGKPLAGQRVRLVASAGTLSTSEATTGSDGAAQVTYIAPGMNENVSTVTITATPIQNSNYVNSDSRFLQIRVTGPDIPVATFTNSPATPAQFELVTLDAGVSTLSNRPCLATCTYSWTFPDGSTATGQFVTKRFQTQGPQVVSVLVTAPSGTFQTATRTITVVAPVSPIAQLTFSPTNPRNGNTVNFNAGGSQAFNGATIVEYRWNFGGGTGTASTTSSPLNTATFSAPVSTNYLVTLTVVDSNGSTASTTQTVTVAP